MSGWREKWRNAFAVDSTEPLEPTEPQRAVVDRVAMEVARRHLTTPALLFIEMSRPLNYIAAQAMHFFQPIAAIVLDTGGYTCFAEFLEHRGALDYLCRRIEHFEQQYETADKGDGRDGASGDDAQDQSH
jgi:hypothetical protein